MKNETRSTIDVVYFDPEGWSARLRTGTGNAFMGPHSDTYWGAVERLREYVEETNIQLIHSEAS